MRSSMRRSTPCDSSSGRCGPAPRLLAAAALGRRAAPGCFEDDRRRPPPPTRTPDAGELRTTTRRAPTGRRGRPTRGALRSRRRAGDVRDASPCATQIVAGSDHFCARMSDGTVRCWGDDAYGALGAGSRTTRRRTPEPDAARRRCAPSPAHRRDAAQRRAARRRAPSSTDGERPVLGRQRQGQLGLDGSSRRCADEVRIPTPTPVALRDPAVRVDVGPG